MSSGSRDPELFDGEPDLRDDPDYQRWHEALTLESIQSQDQEEQEDAQALQAPPRA